MSASIARRIEAFKRVRDLPYRFNFLERDKDRSCATKAALLQDAFDLASRRICCRFRWDDQIGFPFNLLVDAPMPESHHHYLEVKIPETGRWVTVDPTWDAALRPAGFPVAEWDGLNSTPLAVRPFATFSPQQSADIVRWQNSVSTEDWQTFNTMFGRFYRNLNTWIEQQRRPLGAFHA